MCGTCRKKFFFSFRENWSRFSDSSTESRGRFRPEGVEPWVPLGRYGVCKVVGGSDLSYHR